MTARAFLWRSTSARARIAHEKRMRHAAAMRKLAEAYDAREAERAAGADISERSSFDFLSKEIKKNGSAAPPLARSSEAVDAMPIGAWPPSLDRCEMPIGILRASFSPEAIARRCETDAGLELRIYELATGALPAPVGAWAQSTPARAAYYWTAAVRPAPSNISNLTAASGRPLPDWFPDA